MKLRTLSSLEGSKKISNQTVLIRVDYNVPLEEKKGSLTVADDTRLVNSKKTIDWLLENGNKVILLSHLGRPKEAPEAKYSLRPVFNYLKEQNWWPKLSFIDNISQDAKDEISLLRGGEVVILENMRFYIGEKQNTRGHAQWLASFGDVFVNEAFSSCHRAHASTVGIAQILPSYAGFALEEEVNALEKIIKTPARPLVAVVGGAKISDKVEATANLARMADVVLVGGGVANNFIKAQKVEVHKSYLESAVEADDKKKDINYVKTAKKIIEENCWEVYLKDGYIPLQKIVYPVDVWAASDLKSDQAQLINLDRDMHDTDKDKNLMYLDIGPKTIRLFQEIILSAGTVFWNGPMGVFENPSFSMGTGEIARAVAKTSAVTVIGGGDTIDALKNAQLEKQIDFVSTGGSASLEFLAGKVLSGLAVLAP
ncbi:phosphoglycerate kinase [Microgenomates group bacterium]|nr:phosphoglycerate kinase [Microgenomates group bacterium]